MHAEGSKRKRIAIIGAGVAGIVSAWRLHEDFDVTLFEKNEYLGGHTNTVTIPSGPDAGLGVDTGFIVLNDRTYPNFRQFLDELEVETQDTEMSFSFQCDKTGLSYGSKNLGSLFAQRRNILSPAYYRFLLEITHFNRNARRALEESNIPKVSLGEYLQRGGYSSFMIENYLLPMAAAIWSTPTLRVADFPAEAFLRFFSNHGLLTVSDHPQWMTVVGGSHSYIKAFQKRFKGEVRLKAGIDSILREDNGVRIHFESGNEEQYDMAILSAHADQSLALLRDADDLERGLLGPWRYQPNHTVLHTDESLLPRLASTRSAWNFIRTRGRGAESHVFVSYSMNILQNLSTKKPYTVTLNHEGEYA
ncbi:MAG: FAD-dependent oxidoreductase [Pyrinomonadaceae bacterium]